jgi:hypothetical protein
VDNPGFVTKSITVRGVDGNDIRVSETAERKEVVVAIQQNDDNGRTATVRLTRPQFDALCGSKYSIEVETDLEEAQPNVEL